MINQSHTRLDRAVGAFPLVLVKNSFSDLGKKQALGVQATQYKVNMFTFRVGLGLDMAPKFEG